MARHSGCITFTPKAYHEIGGVEMAQHRSQRGFLKHPGPENHRLRHASGDFKPEVELVMRLDLVSKLVYVGNAMGGY